MAFSKAHLFDPEDQVLSFMVACLSHPARIRIIRYLWQNGPTPVCQLATQFPLSISTLSQHLAILRQHHLVTAFEEFPNTIYSINKANALKIKDLINTFYEDLIT
jgi:ArsR family transcriptional regulator